MSSVPELQGEAVPLECHASDYGSRPAAAAGDKEVRPRGRKPSRQFIGSGNGTVLTAGIIIADVVGAGILSMGLAVAKFGWLLGAAVVVVLLAMNVHISILVWRVRMGCAESFTYLELASAAFSRAPPWQRRAAEAVTLISQQIFLFMVLALYCLSVGRSLGTLFYDELRLCLPMLVFVGLVCFCPVHIYQRCMGQNQFLIALNVLTIVGSAVIPLVHMAGSHAAHNRMPGSTMMAVENLSLQGVMSGLQIMGFAFTSQFMIVEIMAEMRDPAEFPRAYMISAPFQGVMFLIAGVGTYYFMGSEVASILGENLPFGPTFRFASACLLVHMLITYLIKGVVFCRWLQQLWDPKGLDATSAHGWSSWAFTVLVCTSLCWTVAQIVPFFVDLVDLLGATLVPVSCFLVPIVLYLRWLRDFGGERDRVGPCERAVIAAEVLLSLLLMTVGTALSVEQLYKKWHTYGAPFACHCQNLWATCECSGGHPGMEHCSGQVT